MKPEPISQPENRSRLWPLSRSNQPSSVLPSGSPVVPALSLIIVTSTWKVARSGPWLVMVAWASIQVPTPT